VGKINTGRVIQGGLLAGLVINIICFVDMALVVGPKLMAARQAGKFLLTPRFPFYPAWLIAMFLLVLPVSRSLKYLNIACVLAIVGIWIEKGMGLVIPGMTPDTLGEIYECTPSYVEIEVAQPVEKPAQQASFVRAGMQRPAFRGDRLFKNPNLLVPIVMFHSYYYFSSSVSFFPIPDGLRHLAQPVTLVDDRCYLCGFH
jgi:hypothetical protein